MNNPTLPRRRWAWTLLDALDNLTMLPAVRLLRALRVGVYLAAVGAFATGDRSGAVLLLLLAIALEVALFRLVLVELLRGEAGR